MVSEADILNAKILVVDDKQANVLLLEGMLRTAGYTSVESTTDPNAVCGLYRRNGYSLILLDLQMPELDGIGVVRMLKKGEVPMIAFVTAYDEYAVRAFEVNAVDYLLKPVDRGRLRETINRAQERSEHAEIVADQAARRAIGALL